jgi:transcriptional regulator with XRE-family HTH domain
MKSAEFGAYIKAMREAKGIPQRIVAHRLNIDTSTLSKIELGERQVIIEMIKGLADILEIDFKELQIKFISDKILSEYANQPFFIESIENIILKNQK